MLAFLTANSLHECPEIMNVACQEMLRIGHYTLEKNGLVIDEE